MSDSELKQNGRAFDAGAIVELSLLTGDDARTIMALSDGARELTRRLVQTGLCNAAQLELKIGQSVSRSSFPTDAVCADAGANSVESLASGWFVAPIVRGEIELGHLRVQLPADAAEQRRDLVRALSRRLAREIPIHAVHERIAEDNVRLYERAMLDANLPGVWTKTAFDQSLSAELQALLRTKRPLCVVALDLVGLRSINDRFGHAFGDAAMRHFAAVVRHTLRPDDLLARIAGDVLAMMLVGLTVDAAERVVARVQKRLEEAPLALATASALEMAPRPILRAAAGIVEAKSDQSPDLLHAKLAEALRRAKRQSPPIAIIRGDEVESPNSTGGWGGALWGLESGAILGGAYKIQHEIDRGAMGVVYRAEDLGLSRPVAVKMLRPDLTMDPAFVARFRTEASTLAQLRHDNLVQVYSFGQSGDEVHFVMELVEGETLSARISRARNERAAQPLAECARIVREIAQALEAMHHHGILHRDVKPSNIVLDRTRERAVLVDVGIAKWRNGPPDGVGTPGFVAPETLHCRSEGPTVDVYGLAATAYALISLAPAFGDGEDSEVIRRQEAGLLIAPSACRPGLPLEVDEILIAALSPAPNKRPPTPVAFAKALSLALISAPSVLSRGEDLKARTAFAVDSSLHTRMSGKLSADRRKRPAPVALAPSDGASDEGISAYRSRGVLFRIAPSLLPARAAIAWTRKLSEERPDLAARVGDATPLLSWQPSRDLVELLRALPAEGGDPLLFSESVGRAAASLTFLRLVGANPLKLTPEIFLDLLPALWRRYHTWGQVAFDVIGEHGVILHWSDSNVSNSAASPVSGFHPNGEPLLRGITRGLITRAAELAGFHHVQVEPPSGSDHRGPGVVYSLRMTWTAR